jgi:hypothetical protein
MTIEGVDFDITGRVTNATGYVQSLNDMSNYCDLKMTSSITNLPHAIPPFSKSVEDRTWIFGPNPRRAESPQQPVLYQKHSSSHLLY